MIRSSINVFKNKIDISKMSISNKMSLSFIILWTILIIIVIIIIRTIYSMLMFSQFKERVEYTDRLVSQQIERYTQDVNNSSNNMIIGFNAKFGKNIESKSLPKQDDFSVNRSIINYMIDNLLMFNVADEISIVFKNSVVYSVQRRNFTNYVDVDTEKLSRLEKLDVDTDGIWNYPSNETNDNSFYYLKALRNINLNQTIGYVVIRVNEANLLSLYTNDKFSKYTNFYIYNNDGRVLSSSVRNTVGTNVSKLDFFQRVDKIKEQGLSSGNFSSLNKKYYFKLTALRNTDWTFISLVDYDAVESYTNIVTVSILLVSFVALVIFYIIIITISKNIGKPIQQLAHHMLQFQDKLPQAIKMNNSTYEIEVLTTNFNIMIQKNSELFERVFEEQKKKKHFELALLQAQIKPHFLYNTLDTVYCLIGINKPEEAKRTIKLLVDYYRLVLNKGIEWISLEKELLCATKYMEIQKIRHNDIFTYEIDVLPELMQMKVPKLTIQPLIENAIYHGIKPKKTMCTIRISGEMVGNWAYIRVIDDGVGISKQKFEKLLNDEQDSSESDSFGLKNISDRLRLFYGEESKLCLEANIQKETIMTICIFLGNKEV